MRRSLGRQEAQLLTYLQMRRQRPGLALGSFDEVRASERARLRKKTVASRTVTAP
jgi:hypothetical protein